MVGKTKGDRVLLYINQEPPWSRANRKWSRNETGESKRCVRRHGVPLFLPFHFRMCLITMKNQQNITALMESYNMVLFFMFGATLTAIITQTRVFDDVSSLLGRVAVDKKKSQKKKKTRSQKEERPWVNDCQLKQTQR